jgi:hypothetical protein
VARVFIIRDDAGILIKTGAGSCSHLLDAFHAEPLVLFGECSDVRIDRDEQGDR